MTEDKDKPAERRTTSAKRRNAGSDRRSSKRTIEEQNPRRSGPKDRRGPKD